MTDLVGTCPKDFWWEWLAEGDPAGTPETGIEWAWFTRDAKARAIAPGERFYVVAHGRLRGYAPVVRVEARTDTLFAIVRQGGAVAVTLDQPIAGFRGLRRRWWDRAQERPFPDWQHEGCGPRRLTPSQARLVELWEQLRAAGAFRHPAFAHLGTWLSPRYGVSAPEFLNDAQAGIAAQELRAWFARIERQKAR